MEPHVVDLATAKELFEGKYLPEGHKFPFFWHEFDEAGYSNEDCPTEPAADIHYLCSLTWDPIEDGVIEITHHTRNSKIWYTPILSEMLEWLPDHIRYKGKCYNLTISTMGSTTDITYYNYGKCYAEESRDLMEQSKIDHGGFCADEKTNLSTAAAKLFMWAVDNGHVKRGEG